MKIVHIGGVFSCFSSDGVIGAPGDGLLFGFVFVEND